MEQLHPFFGVEWCRQALEVANTTPELQAGLTDPATFTLTLAFEATDRPGLASWAEFRGGVVHEWRPGSPTSAGYVATARAAVDIWQQAADGSVYATNLLLSHKIKIRDPKNRIAANYNGFEALLASWGNIPTGWP